MNHIAIIHAGGIGDLVLTLPALAALRRAWPAATVTWIGRPERAILARMAGVADRCVDLETCGLWRLGLDGGPAPAALRDADLVIDFLASKETSCRHQDTLRRQGGRTRIVPIEPLPPEGYREHASTWINLQVAAALQAEVPPAPPEIRVADAAMDAARQIVAAAGVSGRFVAVHAGSGSTRKNWPADRFAAVAERIREEAGREVVWLAGPAERERRTLPPQAGAVLPDLSLEAVAGVLALADVYVGNDSGISHVAAAVRPPSGGATPAVVLFGPTDPRVWAPLGPNVSIVASGDGTMNSIGAEQVWREVARHVGQTGMP